MNVHCYCVQKEGWNKPYLFVLLKSNKLTKYKKTNNILIKLINTATLFHLILCFTANGDEVRVVVHVRDENDNSPAFEGALEGRPVVAAIPASASYGDEVVRLKVRERCNY